MQGVWNFCRPFLTVNPIRDRHLAHSKGLADKWCEMRHRAPGCSGKNCAQRFGLLVVGALIDVGGDRPVSLRHGAGRMNGEDYIQSVKRRGVITPAVDVEYQNHVAFALGRSRREGRALRDEAWTHDTTIAVLEIIS